MKGKGRERLASKSLTGAILQRLLARQRHHHLPLLLCVLLADELSISSFLSSAEQKGFFFVSEAAGFQNFPQQQLQKGTLSLLVWSYLSLLRAQLPEVPCRTKASHDRTLLMACMLYTSILPLQQQPRARGCLSTSSSATAASSHHVTRNNTVSARLGCKEERILELTILKRQVCKFRSSLGSWVKK